MVMIVSADGLATPDIKAQAESWSNPCSECVWDLHSENGNVLGRDSVISELVKNKQNTV